MLVRKLKAGDRLSIGDDIFLDCLKVGQSALRLAISAPDGVILTVIALIDRDDEYSHRAKGITAQPECSEPNP